jgi:hypothetical protein
MDAVGLAYLGRFRYDDLLREAEQRKLLSRSPAFRKLPRLAQILILVLS